jgi:uncharacterized protein YdeI (YjbR/CyaY-like superfamily)
MNAPEIYIGDRSEWRRWLEQNHAIESSVWLIFNKGAGRKIQWSDIVQEALCFGWIDGRANKVSETRTKIYISRRKPKSVWSKINKGHVEMLIDQGLMRPAGLAAIEIARSNGSWDVLNRSDNLEIPLQLQKLFTDNSIAKAHFDAFPNSSKRVILEWIYSAKTDTTQQKRIDETVRLASENIRAR